MPPLLDRLLPGTKNPLHETQGKPAPVSLIAAGQSLGVRNWLGRGALITVASPEPATMRCNHSSPADSPAHSRPALLPRFHRSGALWNPLWALLFRFAVFRVRLLRRSIRGLSEGVKCLLVRIAAHIWGGNGLGGLPTHKGGPERPDPPNGLRQVYYPALAEKGSLAGHDSAATQGPGICTPILGCSSRAQSSTRQFSSIILRGMAVF